MSYGIEVRNQNGSLIFSDTGRTMQVVTRGTTTIFTGENTAFVDTGILIADARDLPLILLDELNGLKTYSAYMHPKISTGTWVFWVLRSQNNVSTDMDVNWFVCDTHNGLPAPTGYGLNIFNEDGVINFTSEVEFLMPIKCGSARRNQFPIGISVDEELPTKYIESRHIYDKELEFYADDIFTTRLEYHHIVRYNGDALNPNFVTDVFYNGASGGQDGGSGGLDGIVQYYGNYIPVMLFRHPDSV
jgi:hypothetical protein